MAGIDSYGEGLVVCPALVRSPRHIAIHNPAPVRRQGEGRHSRCARTAPAVTARHRASHPACPHHRTFRHIAQGHRHTGHLLRTIRVGRIDTQLRRQRYRHRCIRFCQLQVGGADTDIPFHSDSDRATAAGRAFIGGRHHGVADGRAIVVGTARHPGRRIVRREHQTERRRQCPRQYIHCQDVTHQGAAHRRGTRRQVVEGIHQAGPGL